MKLEINGLHISAAAVAVVLYLAFLPTWPALFVFILGQFAATYITGVINVITPDDES